MSKIIKEEDYIKYGCNLPGVFIRPAVVEGKLRWVVERYSGGTALLANPQSLTDDGMWIVQDEKELE